MAQISIGSTANEFVALLDSDPAAPILRQVETRPKVQSDAQPRENDPRHLNTKTGRKKRRPKTPMRTPGSKVRTNPNTRISTTM